MVYRISLNVKDDLSCCHKYAIEIIKKLSIVFLKLTLTRQFIKLSDKRFVVPVFELDKILRLIKRTNTYDHVVIKNQLITINPLEASLSWYILTDFKI